MKKATTNVYWSAINGQITFSTTGEDVSFDARGRTRDYYYQGSKVSRENEQYITIFQSKWYSMM